MQGKSFTDFKDDGIPEWLIMDGAHAHYTTHQLLSKMMETSYDREESTKNVCETLVLYMKVSYYPA
jgi:hypothetical protein